MGHGSDHGHGAEWTDRPGNYQQGLPAGKWNKCGPCWALPEGLRLMIFEPSAKVCHEMSFQDLPRFQRL